MHAADEFHLLCGRVPPPSDAPDQYENGIGMSALLLEEAAELEAAGASGRRTVRRTAGERPRAARRRSRSAPSACSPAPWRSRWWRAPAKPCARASACPVRPFAVVNDLFGPHVTVTGLLGGAEVLAALGRDPLGAGEWLVAPRVFLPEALGRTLDDVGEDELAAACGGRLVLAASLREAFATLAE